MSELEAPVVLENDAITEKMIAQYNKALEEKGLVKSGVINPVYFSVNYKNGKKDFGKSNRFKNEYESLDKFVNARKMQYANVDTIQIYLDEAEYKAESQKYNSLGVKQN